MIPLIAVAVRADAEAALAERLVGLDWAFVDYVKPGVATAQAVRAIVARRGRVDIIVLGNHGIVFAGDEFAEVDELVVETTRRFAAKPRATPEPDYPALARLSARFGLEAARMPAAHRAALDPAALDFATRGSLYPDHVVFLGRGAARLVDGHEPDGAESLLYLIPSAGALLAAGLTDSAHEMAACLAEVAIRIEPGASLRTLSRREEDALIDWDAEAYRRGLARSSP